MGIFLNRKNRMGDDGCVKNETKLKMSKLVGFVSIAIGVLAILMIAFGVTAFNGLKKRKVGDGKYSFDIGMGASVMKGVLAIACGVLGLIISFLGCCTIKYKHICVTCPFVICSFLIGLLALIAGGMVMGGGARDQVVKTACTTRIKDFGNKNAKQIMRAEYRDIVDKVMCSSDLCPCGNAAGVEATWKTAKDEAGLKKFQRTWVAGTFDRQQNNAVIPMTFQATGTTYTTYKTCYNKVVSKLATNSKAMKNANFKKASKEFTKGGWKFLSDLEKTANCAGLCETPLFFLTKDISSGPPTQDCIAAFTKAYGGNMLLGAVAFITAITLICVGICALPLCTDYNKDTQEEEE